MPTQLTAFVNGARLTARALPTGMAHGLPRSDHSAGERDSPAANGALLTLTGLLLEQESELSGAVVGGAVGQQDQGEQSPMAATEMERRIGLMGCLNDAAARFRQQPEPEVADNDADLWYAACFACTTSLQVVRLFRSQRAELPRRDPMGEAYLVVLAPLVGSAEENRERLEGTAIPNIDDGLANARAALLAEAHAAIDRRQLVLPVATTIFAGRDGVIIRYGGTVDYRPTNQAIEAETYGRQDTGNGSGQGWDERAFSAQVAEWAIAVAGETGASVAHSARSLRRGVGG